MLTPRFFCLRSEKPNLRCKKFLPDRYSIFPFSILSLQGVVSSSSANIVDVSADVDKSSSGLRDVRRQC